MQLVSRFCTYYVDVPETDLHNSEIQMAYLMIKNQETE